MRILSHEPKIAEATLVSSPPRSPPSEGFHLATTFFKRWIGLYSAADKYWEAITPSAGQRFIQLSTFRAVNAIYRINHYPGLISVLEKTIFVIHWIAINPGPVVRISISANPGLNFNPGFFFFGLKAFSKELN